MKKSKLKIIIIVAIILVIIGVVAYGYIYEHISSFIEPRVCDLPAI